MDSWKSRLGTEFAKPYFVELTERVRQAYSTQVVFPPGPQIFNAFNQCSFEDCKVVILGQDPYHGPGQANGLSFSVNSSMRIPPSLRNIFKEIEQDLGISTLPQGDLERWAKQGVLLLNATLTVPAATPGGHQKWGWERFTDAVIDLIAQEKEHVVFMLWGSFAQKKASFIEPKQHLILRSTHPSPMSANRGGWFGSGHFSRANAYLRSHGLEEIDWK
ncbi:uracil-DNA glycosylase [Dyadobacter jejuensis]|uniref:Uracil-DNA glycosylase n=1 Tax=Dyadobacter jejuensis TaxID=1082580 RepID=A0A316AIS6_9BACT|nr:uracil-DNA glycosylase [Dyadobacter jejuensis]PWJ56780.1 uracil-DNA glycosylase [Dyadobacter jejuensis]